MQALVCQTDLVIHAQIEHGNILEGHSATIPSGIAVFMMLRLE
jgi:hypothetical protein